MPAALHLIIVLSQADPGPVTDRGREPNGKDLDSQSVIPFISSTTFARLTHATRINQSSAVTFLKIHPFDRKRATTNIDAVAKTAIVTPRVSGVRDSPISSAVDQYLRKCPSKN